MKTRREWHTVRDRERVRVTYKFRVSGRVRLRVRANYFQLQFADGVFNISIFTRT